MRRRRLPLLSTCIALGMVAGCSSILGIDGFSLVDGGADDGPRPIDVGDDGVAIDAGGCLGSGAFSICLASSPTGAVVLAGPFDTTTASECLATQPVGWIANGQPAACFVAGATVKINSDLVVTGARPLVLVATDAITVSAGIDAASHRGGSSGPAANSASCTVPVAPVASGNGGGGGAGGAFRTVAGNGGSANNAGAAGGTAGAIQAKPGVLRGGCSGQTGGTGQAAAGAAGPGGGVIYLAAGASITIDGTIDVSGAGGAAGGKRSGGSGAGSGGMILLSAPILSGNGVLFANGGGGAAGADDNAGADGADPVSTAPLVRAPGGGSVNGSGAGGEGFAFGQPATAGGNGTSIRGGGGGGGGAGYLRSNVAHGGFTTSPVMDIIP